MDFIVLALILTLQLFMESHKLLILMRCLLVMFGGLKVVEIMYNMPMEPSQRVVQLQRKSNLDLAVVVITKLLVVTILHLEILQKVTDMLFVIVKSPKLLATSLGTYTHYKNLDVLKAQDQTKNILALLMVKLANVIANHHMSWTPMEIVLNTLVVLHLLDRLVESVKIL